MRPHSVEKFSLSLSLKNTPRGCAHSSVVSRALHIYTHSCGRQVKKKYHSSIPKDGKKRGMPHRLGQPALFSNTVNLSHLSLSRIKSYSVLLQLTGSSSRERGQKTDALGELLRIRRNCSVALVVSLSVSKNANKPRAYSDRVLRA